jgi:dGTPase
MRELFTAFFENTGLLPDEFQAYAEIDKARAVALYRRHDRPLCDS